MGAGLPDLLDTLGEVFLVPGAFPAEALAALGQADWAPTALRDALGRMRAAALPELAVAYTGLFLVGVKRPPVPLELSIHRSDRYLDGAVLEELEASYDLAGLVPDPRLHADHLGLLLPLLGHLLRRLVTDPQVEATARLLLARSIGPLAKRVEEGLRVEGTPGFYAAAGRALGSALGLATQLLA